MAEVVANMEEVRGALLASQAENALQTNEIKKPGEATLEKDAMINNLKIQLKEKKEIFNQVVSGYTFRVRNTIVRLASKIKAFLRKK